MRKSILLAVSFSALSACGTQTIEGTSDRPVPPNQNISIDHMLVEPELRPSVLNAISLCERFGGNSAEKCRKFLPMLKSVLYVEKIEKDVVGRCTIWSNGRREVIIKKNAVEQGSISEFFLVMHEVAGHCLTEQDHAPRESLRVMAPSMLSEYDYANNYTTLVKDLFTNPAPSLVLEFRLASRVHHEHPEPVAVFDIDAKNGCQKVSPK
jgi:hypothetical protein